MSVSIVVVGGYGVVGSRAPPTWPTDFLDRVVVAGRHIDRAEAAAPAIGRGVRGRGVDISLAASINTALAGVGIVVNCIDQPQPACSGGASATAWPTPTEPPRA